MTQDADFAQFWGVSENINDSMEPPLQILQTVDPTFKPVPHLDDPFVSTAYRNRRGYRVDFLTPNRGASELAGKPARMKALAGAGAQPLRHLDFLIRETERSVLVHNGGIPVTIPRAERFAVHKIIVAVERQDQTKSMKDMDQAEMLINVLAHRRPMELAAAWRTASDVGPRWREKLNRGVERLPQPTRNTLEEVIARAKKKASLEALQTVHRVYPCDQQLRLLAEVLEPNGNRLDARGWLNYSVRAHR